MLTFAVLGPTEVRDDGRLVELGGPVARRLLTALLAAEGRAVSDDRLAEAAWEGRPPASPRGGLQVYVSRLRRVLGDAGRDLLCREPSGYRLAAGSGATDAERFARQVDAARLLASAGRDEEALSAFEEALRLWRGEPFADLPADPGVTAARVRLEELRDAAEEDQGTYAGGNAPGQPQDGPGGPSDEDLPPLEETMALFDTPSSA